MSALLHSLCGVERLRECARWAEQDKRLPFHPDFIGLHHATPVVVEVREPVWKPEELREMGLM